MLRIKEEEKMGRHEQDCGERDGFGFPLVVVLFILLIIIGSAYMGNRGSCEHGYY